MKPDMKLKFFVDGNEAFELDDKIKNKLTDRISEAVSKYIVTEQDRFEPPEGEAVYKKH